MTTDIEQIRDRIRRLRAMTVENGCTEAEAAVAAEKALDLMLNRAVEDGLKTFREGRIYRSKRNPQAKRQATAEFTEAMVERLSRMLWKRMKQAHDEETYALACNALEERVPDARTVQHRNQRLRHWDARAAGHAAAGVVRLMDAVKTGFFRKQIGKG